MDLRLQNRERHAHVRWVDRDAGVAPAEVVLDGIGIAEVLGCLHHGQLRLGEEKAEGAMEEVLRQDKVGVDDQDALPECFEKLTFVHTQKGPAVLRGASN